MSSVTIRILNDGDFGTNTLLDPTTTVVTRTGQNTFLFTANSRVGVVYPRDLFDLIQAQLGYSPIDVQPLDAANANGITDYLLERLIYSATAISASSVTLRSPRTALNVDGAPLFATPPPNAPVVTATMHFYGGTGRMGVLVNDPPPGGVVVIPTAYGLNLATTSESDNAEAILTLYPFSDPAIVAKMACGCGYIVPPEAP
jgi:hypothetical protein